MLDEQEGMGRALFDLPTRVDRRAGWPQCESDPKRVDAQSHCYTLTALSMKYSLVCHVTRTRVVVGGDGSVPGEMHSALGSDDSREAFSAFLMHNRMHAMFLLAESWEGPMNHLDYYEFSAWSRVNGSVDD